MTAGQINKALDKLDRQSRKIGDRLIAAGRGNECPSERRDKTDSLSVKSREVADAAFNLRYEIKRRYGSDIHRLPSGCRR